MSLSPKKSKKNHLHGIPSIEVLHSSQIATAVQSVLPSVPFLFKAISLKKLKKFITSKLGLQFVHVFLVCLFSVSLFSLVVGFINLQIQLQCLCLKETAFIKTHLLSQNDYLLVAFNVECSLLNLSFNFLHSHQMISFKFGHLLQFFHFELVQCTP